MFDSGNSRQDRGGSIRFALAATLLASAALTSCHLDKLTAPPVDESAIEFNVSGDSVVILGDSLQMTADFDAGDGTGVTRITWLSLDTSIARVNDTTGVVFGVGAGSTEISAHLVAPELDHDLVRTLPVEVVYAGIGMVNDSLTGLGETRTLVARGLDIQGNPHEPVPAFFSTADDSIVSLDTSGVVVALRNGQATIDARWGDFSAQAPILVRQVAARIDVALSELMFPTVQTDTTVSIDVRDTQDSLITAPALTWTSSDPARFSVTPDGVIRALQRDIGTINVSSDTVTTQFGVTVATSVASLEVNAGNNQTAVVASAVSLPPSVIARDGAGNPIEGALVTFAAIGSDGQVTDAVRVTDASGAAQAGGWTLGTTAGADSLIATADTVSLAFMATATPAPASPATSSLAISSDTVASGSTMTITLQAEDVFGNVVTTGGRAVVFTAGGGTSTGVIGSTTDNGDGTYSATFTGQGAGTAMAITGWVDGSEVMTPKPAVTVINGPPVQMSVSLGNNQTSLVGSLVFVPPAVLVMDAFGNPVPNVSVDFAATVGGGSVTGPTANTNASGVATVGGWTLGTVVGGNALTATAGGLSAVFSATAATTAPSAVTSLITSSLNSILAGGLSLLTVQTKDDFGNDLTAGGFTVEFSASGGTSTGIIGPTVDNGDGTYSATFTGNVAGSATTITASLNGTAISTPSPTIGVLPGALSLDVSGISASAGTISAGLTSVLTLTAKDAFGNLIPAGGETVVFSTVGGTSGGVLSPTTDNGDGTYTAVFTGQIAGTSATVAASVGGVPVTTTPPTLTVIPGAASAVASVVMASAGTVASNTGATLTLIAKDAFGNQLISGGDAISFAAGGGTSTGNIGTAVDNGDGTYTATFTGILAGTATTVGAAVNGQNVTTAQPTITVVPGAAANVAIQAGNGQFALPLFSVAIAPAVIVTDNHGNPVPGVSVTFAVTLGGGVVLPTSAISTGTDGVARVVAWTLGLLGNQRLRATASVGNVTFTAETLLSLE